MRRLTVLVIVFVLWGSNVSGTQERNALPKNEAEAVVSSTDNTDIFPRHKTGEISLTVDEAIIIALRDNRDILLKSEDVKKAKFKIAEAQASLFPTLNFTGAWTDTLGYYEKDSGQTTTQTTLKQYLYKGGRIINTIKYNGYNFEVAQAILDKTKSEIVLSVKKSFYTFLLAQELANLNKMILDNTKAHLRVVQERYKYGQASESDILKIKESLSSVLEAYEVSLNQVESASIVLRNLLYLDDTVKVRTIAQLVYEPQEVAYDEGFLKAIRNRPEIKQHEAQQEANKKAIEIAKADTRPSIYASWDYYSRSHLAVSTTKKWNDYGAVGITFSWPIFDGWATKAKIGQAIVDLKETQLAKEKTVKDIAVELKNAFLGLKNAINETKAVQAEIELYKDNFRAMQDKYKVGIVSALDLNDVSLSYEVALFNQKQAIYDYILAKAYFDKVTGAL